MLEVTARSIAVLCYTKTRRVFSYHLEQDASELFDGELEFTAVRKGKRGRGATEKIIVLWITKKTTLSELD